MAWLGKIAGFLVGPILNWFVSFLGGIWANYQARKKIKAEAEAKAAEDMKKAEAIKPDSSASEVDSAIDDASKHM